MPALNDHLAAANGSLDGMAIARAEEVCPELDGYTRLYNDEIWPRIIPKVEVATIVHKPLVNVEERGRHNLSLLPESAKRIGELPQEEVVVLSGMFHYEIDIASPATDCPVVRVDGRFVGNAES